MTDILIQIPEEVRNNPNIKTYTELSQSGSVVFQATRETTVKDLAPIIRDSVIVRYGTYYGEWTDTTELGKLQYGKKHKFKSTNEIVEERAIELAKAQELLVKLQQSL